MDTSSAEPCSPNISPAGRRRRRRFGFQFAGISVAAAGAGMIFRAAPIARAAVFFPAAISAIGYLQASRNTCVLRAREGTFEHDDFSTEPAPATDVAASRRVAIGIYRDAALIGLGAAVLAAATAFLR
jgi:hypothetical protein